MRKVIKSSGFNIAMINALCAAFMRKKLTAQSVYIAVFPIAPINVNPLKLDVTFKAYIQQLFSKKFPGFVCTQYGRTVKMF